MIPTFPKFKSLEWSDRAEFESYSKLLAPHSDFNFVSNWAWNINETMKLSKLNDNLVILFNDYLTGEHYFSFTGKNKIDETAHELINFSKENYGVSILKYVPEEIASQIIDSSLDIKVDESNCDYICRVSDFAESDKLTKKFGSIGNLCRSFLRQYPESHVKVCKISEINKNELSRLFQKWAENKNLNFTDLVEYKAFERFMELTEANIFILLVYVVDKLIGFSTFEFLPKKYATSEFEKCDVGYKGIFQFSMWKGCEYLNKEGTIFLNIQVDLGNPNLIASKDKYISERLLKRFIVGSKEIRDI